MIVIIDYGLGNLLSVTKALESVAGRLEIRLSSREADIKRSERIVLPGVGNFGTGMDNLRSRNLIEPLTEQVLVKKTPVLGICLGMQLLGEVGEESGECMGLGWIPGRVRKLKAGRLKLPHIGWNQIERLNQSPLLPDNAYKRDYFFVHSYVLECPKEFIVARCEYGELFTAVVQRDHIFGIQFHPEKSRDARLDILRNFVRGGSCSKSAWFLSSF